VLISSHAPMQREYTPCHFKRRWNHPDHICRTQLLKIMSGAFLA